jgi:hypothetical protein
MNRTASPSTQKRSIKARFRGRLLWKRIFLLSGTYKNFVQSGGLSVGYRF